MRSKECQSSPRAEVPRGEVMRTPDDVAAMLQLKALGWGIKRIARELRCSPITVRRYLAEGGYRAYRRAPRRRTLTGLEDWLAERFHRHAGNADVVRQELVAEKGIEVSLRTVERAVVGLRRELAAQARATIRFETPPGHQLQIDFGERRVLIGGMSTKVFLFVATLGYSRRMHVRAFRNERQESWFEGLESSFRHFGGITTEVLFDNDRGLVQHHDIHTREVEFNARLRAFARHWGFRPRACFPYRARTKGKDERGVGYVKKNAVAGRTFDSFAALEAHLEQWVREVADQRVHGTTGRALCPPGSPSPQAAGWNSIVPSPAGGHAQGPCRLRHRDRRQCLLGALAADRSHRPGNHLGSDPAHLSCWPGGGGPCPASGTPAASDRSGAL
jgi:transposase